MGNKGAYITLSRDLQPEFTTYEAVVRDRLLLQVSTVACYRLVLIAICYDSANTVSTVIAYS